MAQQMKEAIEDGVSIICVDPANGDRLVGFRTAYTVKRLAFKATFFVVLAFH